MWGLRLKDVSPLRGTSKTKTGSFNAINTVTTQSAGRRTRYSLLNTHYSILTPHPICKCIDRPQMPPSAFDAVVAVAFDRTDVASLLSLYDAHMVDAPGANAVDAKHIGRSDASLLRCIPPSLWEQCRAPRVAGLR